MRLLIALSLVLCVGCAAVSDLAVEQRFEQAVYDYENAVRFSDFDKAAGFLEPSAGNGMAAAARLKMYQVADYVVKDSETDEAGKTARQTVEILYYTKTDPVVRSMTDRQVWRYDATDKAWYLESGLPAFQ